MIQCTEAKKEMTKVKIAHINIQSIKQKHKQLILNDYLIEKDIKILAINETHLNCENKFELNGYTIYRRDRIGKQKGGVSIVVSNTLKSDPIQINSTSDIEIIARKIDLGEKQITFVSYYVPPNQNILTNILETIVKNHENVIIVGDFNAKNELWYCKSMNQRGIQLEELIQQNNLCIHNDITPTFMRSNNILDLLVSTSDISNKIKNFNTNNDIQSDHAMITAEILIGTTLKDRNFNKQVINWEKYYAVLNKEYNNFSDRSDTHIDSKVTHIEKAIMEAAECSKKTVTKNHRVRTLPKYIVDMIREKRKIRNIYLKTRDRDKKTEINKYNERIKIEIEKFQESKWLQLCENSKKDHRALTKIWRQVKSIQHQNQTEDTEKVRLEGISQPTDRDIAEKFAQKLETTFSLDIKNFEYNKNAKGFRVQKATGKHTPITLQELDGVIKHLPKKKAPGDDGILYEHIINLPMKVKTDLLNIYNETLETGVIPTRWKEAKIRMLLKPNKKASEVESYRPISLTSNLAKCLEKIILKRLLKHLESKSYISKYQSGFRKGHCTKDHILRLSQHIQNNFNRNNYTAAVMFDMEKAFDRVWHDGLLYKMNKLNVPQYLQYWIQNFISDRSFFVIFNNCKSNKYKIRAGVPQGCILSPILFSIYFSDISEHILSDKAIYADDLSIWKSDKNLKEIEAKLQQDINKILEFCQTWCLKINVNKTSYRVFTNAGKRKNYEYLYSINLIYDKIQINIDANPKFLGITFDPKLSFKEHIDSISTRIFNRFNILKVLKGRGYKSKNKFLINMYKSLIRPIIEYANFPFISASDNITTRLQKIQNKIIRLCLSSDMYDSTETIHERAKIDYIKPRLIKLSANYIKNIINNKHNIPILEMLIQQEQIDCENEQLLVNRKRRTTCLDEFAYNLKQLKSSQLFLCKTTII